MNALSLVAVGLQRDSSPARMAMGSDDQLASRRLLSCPIPVDRGPHQR